MDHEQGKLCAPPFLFPSLVTILSTLSLSLSLSVGQSIEVNSSPIFVNFQYFIKCLCLYMHSELFYNFMDQLLLFQFFFGLYATLITKYFHGYYLGELKYSQVFLFYLYGTKKLIGVQVLLNYREKCICRSHVFNGCPSFSWLYFSLIFLVSLFNCKFLQYYSLFYLLFLYEPEYKNSKLFYLLFL